MKKLVSVLLIMIIVLSLVGCSGKNTDTSKKAMLVVSFGSSFIENREASIDATEKALEETFTDYDRFTAFTSEIIINIYKDRDNITYDTVVEAMEKIKKGKYGEVLVVPTLVINGEEYDQMMEALEPYKEQFESFNVSSPLLTHVSDYEMVAEAIVSELPEMDDQTAVVLMGHGTHHDANSAYPMLDYVYKHTGHDNVFVGTVEGSPEFDAVAADVEAGGYEKVLLMPLMVVAGDHAHNDMAGDEEDSWKVMFKSMGYEVDYIMKGMGELSAIQDIFIEHANEALMNEE